MVKRVKANINPALLAWARETAGYEPASAALALEITEEKLLAWESGEDQPSIPQLRRLAEVYKRPLAVLYLREPPLSFQPMHDFRRLPDFGPRRFSPELTLDIRRMQQRRLLAIELLEEAGDSPAPLMLETTLQADPEEIGLQIRQELQISYQLQAKWRDPRVAFKAWRGRIEQAGVLVFQSNIPADEASGYAYWADALPFVVVNRKDVYARRTFSLLHELVHLMLHQSGVSDLEVEAPRPIDDAKVEIFCNAAAAAALMPRDIFLAEQTIAQRGPGRHNWDDNVIQALSASFAVSREAVVRRLLTFGRATEAFYASKRAQYAAEFQAKKEQQKAAPQKIARNIPSETVGDLGQPFIKMVLDNYRQDKITLSDVSSYLGVKVRHLPDIEQRVGPF